MKESDLQIYGIIIRDLRNYWCVKYSDDYGNDVPIKLLSYSSMLTLLTISAIILW